MDFTSQIKKTQWRGTPKGAPPLDILSTVNFDQVESTASVLPKIAVVLCHGYGADASDLFSLAQYLPIKTNTGFYSLNAPNALPAALFSAGGRAWFEIDWQMWRTKWMGGAANVSELNRPENFIKSVGLVCDFLEFLMASGVEKIILGGFSQGGMVALGSLLSFIEKNKNVQGLEKNFVGLWLLSTQAMDHEWTTQALQSIQIHRPSAFDTCSVIQSHGMQDPILQFFGAEQLSTLLKNSFPQYTWVPFTGGHEIPERVLQKMGQELEKIS
ncbi:MAG: hypothetical protein QE271_13370 [Bacteriovoracaceae bacterium]|nr:hypothetical protein [Bacteriovoracaceae bacterium]